MSSATLTSREFGRRFRKALSVPFSLNQVCSQNIQEFVTSYAASLGCTDKCFFFPLLSCASSCMGMDCFLELTPHWLEPPIIWTLVITPKSLQRIDVAEHLKQQLLQAQNEAWVLEKNEDTKEHLKKFLFDVFNLNQLQEMLKLSNGHGLAIYNSVCSLHKNLASPEDADVMLRLHSGMSWFTDSRVFRSTVTKTRVNFAIVSTPATVHQTLTNNTNFQELFQQSFLTACAEENHVKFAQISQTSDADKLREIFVSLLKLHLSNGQITYKLSEEAKEKFSQIHDELTDKAKQLVRKSPHKVFQPALAYLGRLSCVLHVLDNMIDAINYKVPVSLLTWNTEISATTVWQARELLGHIVEQRHALQEPTTIEVTQQKVQSATVQLGEGRHHQRTPTQFQQNSPRSPYVSPTTNKLPNQVCSPRQSFSFNNNARRNLMNNRFRGNPSSTMRTQLPPFQANKPATPVVAPIIASVSSAGLPVGSKTPSFNPIISSCETVNSNSLNSGLSLPPALSISVSADNDPPALLSRLPFTSVLDISEEDFLKSHRNSIKKLLKHNVSEITPSRCVQLKLICDPTASDEDQKYTSKFARLFLQRVETLGFGLCDGKKNGNLRHFIFKKKKFSSLGDEQKQMLTDLSVTEVEYNKCFTAAATKEQNGGVVCLE